METLMETLQAWDCPCQGSDLQQGNWVIRGNEAPLITHPPACMPWELICQGTQSIVSIDKNLQVFSQRPGATISCLRYSHMNESAKLHWTWPQQTTYLEVRSHFQDLLLMMAAPLRVGWALNLISCIVSQYARFQKASFSCWLKGVHWNL
jgi:hypothetical protein